MSLSAHLAVQLTLHPRTPIAFLLAHKECHDSGHTSTEGQGSIHQSANVQANLSECVALLVINAYAPARVMERVMTGL